MAEVGSNFEFIDIGEDLVLSLCNGLKACKDEGVLEVSEGLELLVVDGIRGEVVAHPRVDLFFMNKSAKVIFF